MTKKTQKSPKRTKSAKRSQPKARPAQQAASPTKTTAPRVAMKSYILFGADEYAKPRAAKFAAEDADLLAKAAEAMHLRLVQVTEPDVAEIAARLPTGRLHANGKGLVPYVKGEVYSELMCATLATELPQTNPDPVSQDLPRSWDDVSVGHLVIAKESLEMGWWEAIVVERTGDLARLRYRDYPQYPPMVRHRSVVALISQAVA